MLKNKKGFTFIELLVSLVLIAVVVFTLAPAMLYSLEALVSSGNRQRELIEQQGEVEDQLAERMVKMLGGGELEEDEEGLEKNVEIVLKGDGAVNEEILSAVGRTISSDPRDDGFTLNTFVVNLNDDENRKGIRISPASISEDVDISSIDFYIFGEFIEFPVTFQKSEITIVNIHGTEIPESAYTVIQINASYLSFNILAAHVNFFNASDAPFTIKYLPTGSTKSPYPTNLYVDPPNIIAVTSNGLYLTSSGKVNEYGAASFSEKVLYNQDTTTPAGKALNDIAWNPYRREYVAVGEGSFFRRITGGTRWMNIDVGMMIERSGFFGLSGERTNNDGAQSNQSIAIRNNGDYIFGGRYQYQTKTLFSWRTQGDRYFLAERKPNDTGSYKYYNGSSPMDSELNTSILSVKDMISKTYKLSNGNDCTLTVASGAYTSNKGYVAYRITNGASELNWQYSKTDFPTDVTGVSIGSVIREVVKDDPSKDEEYPLIAVSGKGKTNADGKIYITARYNAAEPALHQNSEWLEITPSSHPDLRRFNFNSIAYGGKYFVAGGTGGRFYVGTINKIEFGTDSLTSAVSWEWSDKESFPSDATIMKIEYIVDRFYAVGKTNTNKGIIYSSPNGIDWVKCFESSTNYTINSIAGIDGTGE